MAWTWLAILAGVAAEGAVTLLRGRDRPARPRIGVRRRAPGASRAARRAAPGDREAGRDPARGAVADRGRHDLRGRRPERRPAGRRSGSTASCRSSSRTASSISWWSYSTPLWYAQRVEGRRPDIVIVDDRTRLDENLGSIARRHRRQPRARSRLPAARLARGDPGPGRSLRHRVPDRRRTKACSSTCSADAAPRERSPSRPPRPTDVAATAGAAARAAAVVLLPGARRGGEPRGPRRGGPRRRCRPSPTRSRSSPSTTGRRTPRRGSPTRSAARPPGRRPRRPPPGQPRLRGGASLRASRPRASTSSRSPTATASSRSSTSGG